MPFCLRTRVKLTQGRIKLIVAYGTQTLNEKPKNAENGD
jgi:hypothetical protein